MLAVAVATVTALRYGSAGCDAGTSEGSDSMTRTCLARRENDVGEPSTKLAAAQLHNGSCQNFDAVLVLIVLTEQWPLGTDVYFLQLVRGSTKFNYLNPKP